MGTPRESYEDAISGALNELVSAMSALNMHPDPTALTEGSRGYLSEIDNWAKHSMEHMHAVFLLLNQAHTEREKLRTRVWRLETQLAESRALLRERHDFFTR